MTNKINGLDNYETSKLSDDKFPSIRSEVGNRLKEVIALFNNIDDASKVAEVSAISLRRYASGAIQAPFEPLTKLAKSKNVNLNWLFYGRGEKYNHNLAKKSGNKMVDLIEEAVTMIASYSSINVSAGFGSFNEGVTKPDGQEPYFDSLLQSLRVNPDKCAVFWANGDSMCPTIDDGDQLLVDLSKNEMKGSDKIYLVQNGESVWVKRVRMEWDGVELISDNKEYRPITITSENAQNLQIIGKVVHIGKSLV